MLRSGNQTQIDSARLHTSLYRHLDAGVTVLDEQEESLFRQFGVYTQRPPEAGFFMLRIRIPGGDLNSKTLKILGSLAEQYGREIADVTVRQNIQLHWIRLKDLPHIWSRLAEAGLSTVDAGAESARNILNCPVSGVDHDELYDTSALVRQVNDLFVSSSEFAELPRKFKIAITGCALRCVYPEINDIGFYAVPDYERGGAVFRVRVGGGLSSVARFGHDLGIQFEPEQIPMLCLAIARELKELSSLDSGKLKFALPAERVPLFVEALERRMGEKLLRTGEHPTLAGNPDRTHLGLHGQHQNGFYYAGISLPGGRVSGQQLRRLGELAEEFASGRIRTTNSQNLAILNIPEQNLEALCRELDACGLDYDPSWTQRAVIACSGVEFCKQALTETKGRASRLIADLEAAIDPEVPIRISITGCPNSCGQHHICDIGLEGSTISVNGARQESFQVILGGGTSGIETIGRRIGVRIPAEKLSESVGALLARYKAERFSGESFQSFCLRHTDAQLAEFLRPERNQKISSASLSNRDTFNVLSSPRYGFIQLNRAF